MILVLLEFTKIGAPGIKMPFLTESGATIIATALNNKVTKKSKIKQPFNYMK